MYANVLRAGTLTDERVIRRVSQNFVPTHFNNNDPTRDPNSESAALWHAILKQRGLQGQGIWIVGPDGQMLDGMSAEQDGHPSDRAGKGPGAPWKPNRRFADAVVELLDRSLAKFGPVTPREAKPQPLPFRGAGVRPDGGVRLVAYNRADNGLAFSVPMSREQWQSMRPAKCAAGERWALPLETARQFAPVLSPYADTRFRPRPGDATTAELSAEIESCDDRQATVRLTGRWRVDWTHDDQEHSIGNATAQGIAVFDRTQGQYLSLLMIFDGDYNYTNSRDPRGRPQRSSAVVRWRLTGAAE